MDNLVSFFTKRSWLDAKNKMITHMTRDELYIKNSVTATHSIINISFSFSSMLDLVGKTISYYTASLSQNFLKAGLWYSKRENFIEGCLLRYGRLCGFATPTRRQKTNNYITASSNHPSQSFISALIQSARDFQINHHTGNYLRRKKLVWGSSEKIWRQHITQI